MVVEIVTKRPDGSAEATAFRSERLPWILEDKLKSKDLRKCLAMAGMRISPEEVLRVMPMPATHSVFWAHPKTGKEVKLDVVAQYPLAEWERLGAPYMSQQNWCELVMRICTQNMTELGELYRDAAHAKEHPDMPAICTQTQGVTSQCR